MSYHTDPIRIFTEAIQKGPLSNRARPVRIPLEVGLDRAIKAAEKVVKSPLSYRYFTVDNGFYLFQVEWGAVEST